MNDHTHRVQLSDSLRTFDGVYESNTNYTCPSWPDVAVRAEVINKALPSHGVTSQTSPNLRKRAYADEGLQVSLSTRSIHPFL